MNRRTHTLTQHAAALLLAVTATLAVLGSIDSLAQRELGGAAQLAQHHAVVTQA
jgi:hypothetical protein